LVDRFVFTLTRKLEAVVIVFGIPEVESEVNPGAGGVLEELRLSEVGIAFEELNPGPLGPIGFFERPLFSWLDFELP